MELNKVMHNCFIIDMKKKMHEIKPMSMKYFIIRTPSEISVLERNNKCQG